MTSPSFLSLHRPQYVSPGRLCHIYMSQFQTYLFVAVLKEEARRLGHNFVGTTYFIGVSLVKGLESLQRFLKSMGINLKAARVEVEVEKIIERGSGLVAVEIPFTPHAKGVLELSLEEARQLGVDMDDKNAITKDVTRLIGKIPMVWCILTKS